LAVHSEERFPDQGEQLAIVPMAREDLDRVVVIERECFPTAWRRESYERELLNANARYLVARVGERVVGYAGMWVIAPEAHITTVAVEAEQRGRGIGERLLVALLEAAQDMGASRVTLEVRESNQVARALYEKYGFEAVAFMRGYYPDTGEDAVVMWLNALPRPSSPRAGNEACGGKP
jgi:ribosomal-protein-alanine N-acetyltransferase